MDVPGGRHGTEAQVKAPCPLHFISFHYILIPFHPGTHHRSNWICRPLARPGEIAGAFQRGPFGKLNHFACFNAGTFSTGEMVKERNTSSPWPFIKSVVHGIEEKLMSLPSCNRPFCLRENPDFGESSRFLSGLAATYLQHSRIIGNDDPTSPLTPVPLVLLHNTVCRYRFDHLPPPF